MNGNLLVLVKLTCVEVLVLDVLRFVGNLVVTCKFDLIGVVPIHRCGRRIGERIDALQNVSVPHDISGANGSGHDLGVCCRQGDLSEDARFPVNRRLIKPDDETPGRFRLLGIRP